jgi:dihydrofolate reductase
MGNSEPVIALIVAVAENGVIGRNGRMPWRIPSEWQHFKKTTIDKPVIMGRKTFDSLKNPLEGRDDIVMTHNREYAPVGAIAVESVEQALKVAQDCAEARSAHEIMVIGGAAIYKEMLPQAGRLYLTRVHAEPEGDVHVPEIDLGEWTETSRSYHPREEGDEHDYTIFVYERAG